MDYTLTEHVKERYAERIMGRSDKTDIRTFIAQHENKIYDDISKMVDYGTVIYEGTQIKTKDPRPSRYILNGNWMVVVNHIDGKVVTLYKIDLGAGDEFNQLYIHNMLEKLEAARVKQAETVEIIRTIEKSYEEAIQENEALIQDYKQKIKSLEEQNKSLSTLLQEQKTNISIAEEEMRDIIAVMTSGTKF